MTMRFFILTLLLCLIRPLYSQDLQSFYHRREARLQKEAAPIPKGGEASEFIRKFYEKHPAGEAGKAVKLLLIDERESLTGRHFLYRQYFDKWPLFDAELKVNTRGLSKLSSALDLTFDLSDYALRDYEAEFRESDAEALMRPYCQELKCSLPIPCIKY